MGRAPKKCGRLDCETRVTGATYCPEHTPTWAGSTRRTRLPANWDQLRRATEARANGRCEALVHDPRCSGLGSDCDHIIQGDNHSPHNLQWLNVYCHRAKTARENRHRNRGTTHRR